MATIFSVIGSHQDDPDRFILLGDDGLHYELESPLGTPTPVEPTDEWLFDPVVPLLEEIPTHP